MTIPQYPEYATCTLCGYKKYCRQVNHRWYCYACDHNNIVKKDKRK